MNTKATWSISLYCDCPSCGQTVDLIDHPDFWDSRKLQIGTERECEEVSCPECFHVFEVDVEQ